MSSASKAIRVRCAKIALAAMTVLALAPVAVNASTAGDISAPQVFNTSPLWADTASYHACNIVNVTTSTLTVLIELISASGSVVATSGTAAVTVNAGTSYELNGVGAGYQGFARCRFTTSYGAASFRANITVFNPLPSGAFQTYAISEAR
jgi:hypothetical protein